MAKSVEVRLFINGKVRIARTLIRMYGNQVIQFTPSSDGGRFPIKSPYSGETVAEGELNYLLSFKA